MDVLLAIISFFGLLWAIFSLVYIFDDYVKDGEKSVLELSCYELLLCIPGTLLIILFCPLYFLGLLYTKCKLHQILLKSPRELCKFRIVLEKKMKKLDKSKLQIMKNRKKKRIRRKLRVAKKEKNNV